MKLFPEDRQVDFDGDSQSSLEWKIQTVISNGVERAFLFAEMADNDLIKLTKMNSRRKPLYNNGLCQLEFYNKFTVRNLD